MAVRMDPGSPLTHRVQEVIRLVVGGMTNRQVATRLSLSVRTVEAHLRSAYAKTETGTRTRLVLWMAQQETATG